MGVGFDNPDYCVELAQQKSQALRSGHGGFQHPGVAAQSIVGNQIGTRQHKAKALELAGESVGHGHPFTRQGSLRGGAELGATLVQGCRHEKKTGVQTGAKP